MSNNTKKLLQLDRLGVVVYSTYFDSQDDFVIKVGKPRSGAKCPDCQTFSNTRHQKGKYRKALHLPDLGGRRVFLLLRADRYLCSVCSQVFTERFSFLSPRQRLTTSACREVVKLLLRHSFQYLANTYGINYKTALKALERAEPLFLYSWDKAISHNSELSLGIDAHSFSGRRMVTTVTNITDRQVVTIIPNERKRRVKKFLQNLPGEVKELTTEVCIDMDHKLKAAIEESLPSAQVVVDHFHVIQDANQRINEARRIEQDTKGRGFRIPMKIWLANEEKLNHHSKLKLEGLKKLYPTVAEFHWMKEGLRKMYKTGDKEEAERWMDILIQIAKISEDAEMNQWGRMLSRWRDEILAYFNKGTTNAYTEGVHTKMKLIKRISYGFKKVSVYVRKVLLAFIPLGMILSHHTFGR